jgi:hypothetical protein
VKFNNLKQELSSEYRELLFFYQTVLPTFDRKGYSSYYRFIQGLALDFAIEACVQVTPREGKLEFGNSCAGAVVSVASGRIRS